MMKIIFCLALSLAFMTTAFGQAKPDFSGGWTINPERTKSPIAVVTKNINQNDTEIEILNDSDIVELITQKPAQGIVFKLDGAEVLKEFETSAGKVPVSYSVRFVAGNLEISRKQKNAQTQAVSSSVTEIWSLTDGGKTLNIKSIVSDASGEKTSEFFFDKDPPGYDGKLKSSNAGKVINGKARELVKPPYPVEARGSKAEGSVLVKVLLDEKGNVVFAKGVYGHPKLFPASEQAARRSKFLPTKINDVPVKTGGIIVYSFAVM